MSDASVHIVNGPTDLPPDELAERKRLAAVDYHTREVGLLRDSLAKLEAEDDPDDGKIVTQRQMIAGEEAALAAVKEG